MEISSLVFLCCVNHVLPDFVVRDLFILLIASWIGSWKVVAGPRIACFASVSTVSFSGICLWPGIHISVTWLCWISVNLFMINLQLISSHPNLVLNFVCEMFLIDRFYLKSFLFNVFVAEARMVGYFLGRVLGSNKRRQNCWRDINILVSTCSVLSLKYFSLSLIVSLMWLFWVFQNIDKLFWYVGYEVHPKSKIHSRPEMVWWECSCVAVEREYVGIMQCSFSLVTAVVIAQC